MIQRDEPDHTRLRALVQKAFYRTAVEHWTAPIERQIRDPLYGKTSKRTSTFLAHDEKNEAKVGDKVSIAETRPLSARKRWVVTSIVEKAKEI